MTDSAVHHLMNSMFTKPTIILIEDVDAAHSSVAHERGDGGGGGSGGGSGDDDDDEEEAEEDPADAGDGASADKRKSKKRGNNKLTLSGLLNALDGPGATEGHLLFMTTNHKDKLDKALIRPGRIDYDLEFKCVTRGQVRRLFSYFYSDFTAGETALTTAPETAAMALTFSERVVLLGKEFCAADIQGHLMRHKTSPEEALATVTEELGGAATSETSDDGRSSVASSTTTSSTAVPRRLDSFGGRGVSAPPTVMY